MSENLDILAEGRFARFVRRGHWEYVERTNNSGVVVILAVTPDDEVILVEQYRPPVQARVIELPAGLSGDIAGQEDEDLELAAIRELEEETGWTAERMEKLIVGPASAGIVAEVVTLFRAHGLSRVGPGGGDESEEILVHHVPRAGLIDWLRGCNEGGILVDPKVYAVLAFS